MVLVWFSWNFSSFGGGYGQTTAVGCGTSSSSTSNNNKRRDVSLLTQPICTPAFLLFYLPPLSSFESQTPAKVKIELPILFSCESVCICVHACLRACVRACVRTYVCIFVRVDRCQLFHTRAGLPRSKAANADIFVSSLSLPPGANCPGTFRHVSPGTTGTVDRGNRRVPPTVKSKMTSARPRGPTRRKIKTNLQRLILNLLLIIVFSCL